MADALALVTPNSREYSRTLGKNSRRCRSRCTRSTYVTSSFGSTLSMSYETCTPQAGASGGISVGGPTSVTSAPIFTRPKLRERATRECMTSPTIATRRPSIRPNRSRIVYMSKSAWVGCSCVPSPAFSTWPRTHLVS